MSDTTEQKQRSVFISDGASGLGHTLIQLLTGTGTKTAAMTTGTAGATLIREAGGLPVYSDPLRPGEIKSMLRLAKADTVIHLAPMVINQLPFLAMRYDPSTLLRMTEVMLEAAQETDVQHIVHLSSAALYGDNTGPANEDAALTDFDGPLVSAMKEAELAVMNAGFTYTIVRSGYLYGPHSQDLVTLNTRLRNSRPIPLGSSSALANWIHADDLARALVAIADRQPQDEIINVVDNQPTSPTAFVAFFAEAHGMQAPRRLPGPLGRANPTAAELLRLSFNASNNKAKTMLDWSPQFKSYQDGLEDIFLTWRTELNAQS